jgi:Fic family protein
MSHSGSSDMADGSSTERWSPIEDLPHDWEVLASEELVPLQQVWSEQASHLRDTQALQTFNERLAREWAIETGILEKLYTLDEGVSRLLVERGFLSSLIAHGATDKDPDYVIALIRDQYDAVEWLFDFVDDERQLSTAFIKELHQLLTRHQVTTTVEDQFGTQFDTDLLKGEWRSQPTRIARVDGGSYQCCPSEQLSVEMDRLIALHHEHRELGVPPEIEAAWLHHRFTQIHPFQDGNGRVARALATLAFLREQYFPLVVRRSDRVEYLQALYAADRGDLAGLVTLFAKLEKKAFVDALGISRDVLHERAGLSDILDAAADRLRERARDQERRMAGVFAYADALTELAHQRADETAALADKTISEIHRDYNAWDDWAKNDAARDSYFHYQIVEAAKKYRYFANTRTYRSWVRVVIRTSFQTDILLSFHCLGAEFRGVMVCSPLTYRRESGGEDSAPQLSEVELLAEEPFQFNYNDHRDVLLVRFGKWLDGVLAVGLDKWRRSL